LDFEKLKTKNQIWKDSRVGYKITMSIASNKYIIQSTLISSKWSLKEVIIKNQNDPLNGIFLLSNYENVWHDF